MTDSPRWPNRWPYFTLLALGFSCVLFGYFCCLWYRHLGPVEKFDLPTYVRSLLPDLPLSGKTTYRLAMHGRQLAVPGDVGLSIGHITQDDALIHAWLRENVYSGQELYSLLRWPLIGYGSALTLTLPFALRAENRMNSEARNGRSLRGPRLVSGSEWNRRIKRSQRQDFWIEAE